MELILLGVGVFMLILAGAAAFLGWDNYNEKLHPIAKVVIPVLVGVALVSCVASTGVRVVDAQEVGVVYHTVGANSTNNLEVVPAGVQIITPLADRFYTYDLSQHSVELIGAGDGDNTGYVRSISSDGQQVNLDITVIFQLKPDKIAQVHRQWQHNYTNGVIIPETRAAVRNVANKFTAEGIYSGSRDELESQIATMVKREIEEYDLFIVTDVLVRDISFTPEFTEAVEKKQIQEQTAKEAQNKIVEIEAEADQKRAEAQGLADAAVIAAQGRAEARIIEAEAEAQALEEIAGALESNPDLLQYTYIKELGDNVEIIILPNNSPYLFDFNSLTGATPN